jgi:hypothetical protein
VTCDDNTCFLRASRGYATLADFFDLNVNYGPALVNRHQIELFVRNRRGCIASNFTRLRWEPSAVLDSVRGLLRAPR